MATSAVRFAVTSWGKEYQLTATEPIKEGEVIVSETPLVAVLDATPRYSTPTWDLVDKILLKTDLTQRYCALCLKVTKYLMDPEDNRIERNLAKKHRRTRDFVKKLYFGVATNNIGYVDARREIIGHGIYPVISRANHSCRPNATYEPGSIEKKEVTLVALHDVQAGDAITWSYPQSPDFDDADYATRNFALMDVFRFVCSCARCQAEIPSELAMLPNLPRYFDDWIMRFTRAEVEKEIKPPGGEAW
ncbi:SET domain-containing protein-lysine N-methyltransferase [Paraburkholderia sp. B3]|uniref:SET domain-containing protein-lysine N-methyltransferase n=1 Tax=Paraburkholderia sp. B3 TaxID=3134791 RepID=UPI0039825DD2